MEKYIISTTNLKDNSKVFLSEEFDERSGENYFKWDKDFAKAISFNNETEAKEFLTKNSNSFVRENLSNIRNPDSTFSRSKLLKDVFQDSNDDNSFEVIGISLTPILEFKESEVRIPHKFENDAEYKEYVRLAMKFKRG